MTSLKTNDLVHGLPIVDISGLRHVDPRLRRETVETIRRACLDKGFFYCVGHDVDPNLMREVFFEAARFFDRPMSDKLAVDKRRSKANRGYEALGGQTLEAGSPPDLKEGYYVGIETPEDDERAERLINVGPNVWPDGQPEFKPVMLRYFDVMIELASLIMEGIALSLNLDSDYFQTFCTNPLATLRLLHYPPQPANPQPGEKGCGAHTDFGAITILLQDAIGGLEVWDHDEGTWLQAEPLGGGFIVNLGDLMERWTNQRYRSTVHRVINRSGNERYSVPFFFSGNHDYLISCLPGCLEKGEHPRFPPVTVDAHIKQKYAETYGSAAVAAAS